MLSLAAGDTLVARLLLNRGINTLAQARYFLDLSNIQETCALEIPEMDKAIKRINQAICNNEKILIYGDYDVDGTSSVALLYRAFAMIGIEVQYYIPSRHHEGYGLNKQALSKIKNELAVNLVITCDCGISNFQEVDFANTIGLDVIITDHHSIPELAPPSIANCNPKTLASEHPLHYLPGVGVAYKLAELILAAHIPSATQAQALAKSLLDLVALGMIADLAPLRAENRYLVIEGLRALARTEKAGLRKLLEISGVQADPDSEHIGFGLAPRINAAGRLADATRAVRLMITEDLAEAAALAEELDAENRERQVLCNEIYEEALAMIMADTAMLENNVIVLAKQGWNHGVIGIVASRLLDKFHLPVFIAAIDQDLVKGSVRCIDVQGLDIYEEMKTLQIKTEIFKKFGGHKMAAGFSLDVLRVDEFRDLVQAHFLQRLRGANVTKSIQIDAALRLKELSAKFFDRLAMLSPYGIENPQPLFVAGPLKIKSSRLLGSEQKHIKIFVQEAGDSKVYEAIVWNHAAKFLENFPRNSTQDLTLVFTPKLTEYMGDTVIQLDVKDWKLSTEVDPALFARFTARQSAVKQSVAAN